MTPANYGAITSIYMMPDELAAVSWEVAKIPAKGLMVEWGSGGSTCRWLEMLAPQNKRLISIEDNASWYALVSAETKTIKHAPENFQYIYAPEKFNLNRKNGELYEEMPFGTDIYINPCSEIFDADLYFIDGIARSACFVSILLNHQKPNPVVLWHDYVGREDAHTWVTQFRKVEILTGTLARIWI